MVATLFARSAFQTSSTRLLHDWVLHLKLHLLIWHPLTLEHLSLDSGIQIEVFPAVSTSGGQLHTDEDSWVECWKGL